MFKNILLRVIYYASLSGYNTFYKYMSVKDRFDDYSLSNGFMKMYKSSSDNISYLNVFVLSIVSLFIIDFLVDVLVFYTSKRSFKEIFNGINHLRFIFFIVLSLCLLFLNYIISFIVLIIGFIIYIFDIKRYFDKRCLFLIVLSYVFSFVCLYFISL